MNDFSFKTRRVPAMGVGCGTDSRPTSSIGLGIASGAKLDAAKGLARAETASFANGTASSRGWGLARAGTAEQVAMFRHAFEVGLGARGDRHRHTPSPTGIGFDKLPRAPGPASGPLSAGMAVVY